MHSNYKKAHAAPRCQYIRLNEQPCTQPALHGRILCRFHDIIDQPLPDPRLIPFVEDAATLQLALMQVIRAVQLNRMDRRTAGTILYALQIAASNLKYLSAEVGHPLDDGKRKKQVDKDVEVPGPSLAEILLDRLQQMEAEDAAEASGNPASHPDNDGSAGFQPAVPPSSLPPSAADTERSALPAAPANNQSPLTTDSSAPSPTPKAPGTCYNFAAECAAG